MKKVFICSPLRGEVVKNQDNARKYAREAILQGFLPIVPHIYFTQFLNDEVEEERNLGIRAGIELLNECDEMWIYGKPSEGMIREIESFGGKKVWKNI